MKKIIFLLTLIIVTISCTEPYGFQNNNFEDVLVIEATITNELRKQEIKITRTFQLEEKVASFETNATVYITDDLGNQYNFEEENGKYISQFEFQAIPERQYQLFVNTSNGKQYSSTREKLTTHSPITEINANRVNSFGVEGIEITTNSFDPTKTSNYYRFEYEETYKIVTPYWTSDSLNFNYNTTTFDVAITTTTKSYDSSICYNTVNSNEILLKNNTAVSEDRIENFLVRFIPQKNTIIAHRYSILVKQYIQNLEAYTFYKTLKDLSSSGSVLSPNQPGFINGNIKNKDNNAERVIGFFDVSTVSSKRLFFNYNDFFDGEAEPNYPFDCPVEKYYAFYPVVDCEKTPPPKTTPPYCRWGKYALFKDYQYNLQIYFEFLDGNYLTTRPICGECNRLWSTEVPDFWE
ncbi:DUF4249 domain-containing protein [uncultured Flavobacterium sp.]|uniref:DUF4249 domain-containing protein n=1 Tax=uncultured Flavobacterium sp. TaxID=165435 RepID=UPI0030EF09AA|tara:strand:+ start:91000 stop:92220 length:1221 start_codon:yes stop_codon:yes gene_type:complete